MPDVHCRCETLGVLAVIDMGQQEGVFRTFERLRERGGRHWWLSASRCRACATTWLIAQEERQNDIHILKRLNASAAAQLLVDDLWPGDFDRYETLLEIGLTHGRRVRFADIEESSLPWTVADLAREHPGISVSRLALLLNLSLKSAIDLALKTVAKEGVMITFDD